MDRTCIGIVAALLIAGCASPAAPSQTPNPDLDSPGNPSGEPAIGAYEAQRAHDLRLHGGDFYAIPDPMPAGNAGSIVHVQIRYNAADARGYRAMYRSTAVDAVSPAVMTGFIWVPPGRAPEGGWPIVAWAPGFDGTTDSCSYSHTTVRDQMLSPLLADGFVVVVIDYEGHGTHDPYLLGLGESATHALLDGARAARDLLGPAASNRVVIGGHSLGGDMASQAPIFAPDYADGLDIRGVVVTEGGADYERLASGLPDPEAPPASNLGLLKAMKSIQAYANAYPELVLDDILTARGLDMLASLHEDGCVPFPEFDTTTDAEVVDVDIMTIEPWAARYREHTVREAPYPVFYVMAEKSYPIEEIKIVADRLCQSADHVLVKVYAGENHDSVVTGAYSDWGKWLIDRVTDDPPVDGCDF